MIFNNDVMSMVFGSWKTHEVAVAPLVPSQVRVGEHTFTGKSIRFAQSPLAINDFPKFSFQENFCKLHIHQNFPFALQSRVNPHFHSQQISKDGVSSCRTLIDNSAYKKFGIPADIHNEVLPLTLQSEIKQHQIISLIKGNLKN